MAILKAIRTWYIKKNDWRMRMNILMESLLLWANKATYLQTDTREELEAQYMAIEENSAELGTLVLRHLPKAKEEYMLLKEHVIAYYQGCRQQLGKEAGGRTNQPDSYRAIKAAEEGIVRRVLAIRRMLVGDTRRGDVSPNAPDTTRNGH